MERAFMIIELIKQGDCSTLSEFAEQLDCSESTIHYYLKTLERNKYIVRDENGYQIGLRFLTLGGRAKRQHKIYQKISRKALETLLDELSERTEEIAMLATEEYGKCHVLYVSRQSEGRRGFHIGTEHSLCLTAVGKAILSTYDDETVFDIIDSRSTSSTQDPTNDLERQGETMVDKLQRIRNRGFAFNDQERIEGERGIAVPVIDEQNKGVAICSVGIVGSVDNIEKPDTSLKSRRFMQSNIQLVQQTAQTIANKLYM